MTKIETDVIVVAAGPAGLCCAVTLGENGLKTVVFEKSNTSGGAANMGMGPLGINSKVQKRNFNDLSVELALKNHMEYTHWRVDADLVETYFSKSADTIEWLEDMGVKFAGAFKYFKESEATWHIVLTPDGQFGPRSASAMVKVLTDKVIEQGTQIHYETPAKKLIMEDGKCVGVIAIDKNGEEIEARAKAIMIATGGFGNNAEMLKEHFGLTLWDDYQPFMIPGIVGDGLNMMWEVGAKTYGASIEVIYQIRDNMSYFIIDAVTKQPNLFINQNGDRFMDEGKAGNLTYTGNAIWLQPGNYAYSIMDGNLVKQYKKNGPDIFDIVHPADCFDQFDVEANRALADEYDCFFAADTIEDLAKQIEITTDKLQETIDDYNDMCARGRDVKFGKNPNFLHKITGKGKYYAAKHYLAAYGTVGGVKINKKCEVFDVNNKVIPGLFCAGTDANTIYGDSYNFTLPGNTMGFAVNTGRMAGEAIADYINGF